MPSTASPPPLWKAFFGGAVAVAFSAGLYTTLQFLISHLPAIDAGASLVVRNIGLLMRYLLVGSLSLMTFMCGLIGLGLLAYGLQLTWQTIRDPGENR
ncbi:MAG: hypothetical protein OHK0012_22940 [Synechococcales cyanobacterium]